MWEKASEMFPDGKLSTTIEEDYDLQTIKYAPFTRIAHLVNFYARGMVRRQDRVAWTSDGDFMRENVYDVWCEEMPDNMPALSCFGAKMVLDWKAERGLLPNDDEQCKENEDASGEDGFNYTGL